MTDTSPNPFTRALPTQLRAWDATSLRAYQECPKRYYETIVRGWRRPEGPHTRWGGLLHGALEVRDRALARGDSREDALDEAFAWALEASGVRQEDGSFVPMGSTDTKKTRKTLLRALVWYDEEYANDPVSALVFPNGKAAVELSFQLPLPLEGPDGEPYLLCGHMDGLAEWGEEKVVRERKTTGNSISTYYFQRYSPDIQIDTYDLAANVLYPDLGVRDVMIEAIQTGVTMSKPHRHFVHGSDARREEHLADTMYWIKRAEDDARAFKEQGRPYPMNKASCFAHGGCPLRDVCNKDPSVRERYLKGLFEERHWNPLEER